MSVRVLAILLVLAALLATGYYYLPAFLGGGDANDKARAAGDRLVEDARAAMSAIARRAESAGSLRGAGAGIAIKPSEGGARAYGTDGFFLVGSNGVIRAQSPQHGITLTLTPSLEGHRVTWHCTSTAPRERLTSQCR
jgi:hypothetical protein